MNISGSENHEALGHAIMRKAPLAGVSLLRSAVSPWASMTFSGARHSFDILIDGGNVEDAADHLKSTLGEAEFNLPGALVADLAVSSEGETHGSAPCLRVEALTVACA